MDFYVSSRIVCLVAYSLSAIAADAQIQSKQQRQERSQLALEVVSTTTFYLYQWPLQGEQDRKKWKGGLSNFLELSRRLAELDPKEASQNLYKNLKDYAGKSTSADEAEALREILLNYIKERPLMYKPIRSPDPNLGERLFKQKCVVCHQGAQRSDLPQAAAFDAADPRQRWRNAYWVYLHTSEGLEERGMPAFKSTLDDWEIWSLAQHVAERGGANRTCLGEGQEGEFWALRPISTLKDCPVE